MGVYRTITFMNDTPGGGLQVGVKYPIIKIDGVNTIVDQHGNYHTEPEDSRFLDYCQPHYSLEMVDDNTGESYSARIL